MVPRKLLLARSCASWLLACSVATAGWTQEVVFLGERVPAVFEHLVYGDSSQAVFTPESPSSHSPFRELLLRAGSGVENPGAGAGILAGVSGLATSQVLFEEPELGPTTQLGNTVLLSWFEDGAQSNVGLLINGIPQATFVPRTTPGESTFVISAIPASCTPVSEDDPDCPSKAYEFVIVGDSTFTQQFQEVFRTWPLANNAVFCARNELADESCEETVDFAARTCNRESEEEACGIIIGGGNDGPSASGISIFVDGQLAFTVEDAVEVKCLEEAVPIETRGDHVITARGFLSREKAASTVWTDPVTQERHENIVGTFVGLDSGSILGLDSLFSVAEVATVCGVPVAPSDLLVRQVDYPADAGAGIGTGVPAVRASWINGENPYEVGVNVFRDGDPVEALPGNAFTTLVGASTGLHDFGVQGDSGVADGPSEITTESFTLLDAPPVDVAPTGVDCAWSPDGGGTATITWEVPTGDFALDFYVRPSGAPEFTFLDFVQGTVNGLTVAPVSEDTRFLLQFFVSAGNQLYGVSPVSVCAVGAGGGRFPGDINEDGAVDISDPVGLLGHLFLGLPVELPCDGGTTTDIGNLSLLDWNGSGSIDISDASFALSHLFLGSAGHELGPFSECVAIEGCAEQCVP